MRMPNVSLSMIHMNIETNFPRRISSLFLIAALLIGVPAPAALAQEATPQRTSDEFAQALIRIEEKFEKRRSESGVPGAGLAIVNNGRVVLKGFGARDVGNSLAVTPDTVFPVGSVTKAFTALSVLMSQEDGKLSLSDSPKKYIPYFRLQDPDADARIQVRDLLSHSSGLNRTDLAMITGKLDREELIRVLADAKPTAKLREKFQYQNVMYAAAGEIVARVQNEKWETFVPKRIFKPLGMSASTTSVNGLRKAKDRSLGYEVDIDTKKTRMIPYRAIDEVAPAGSINSSVRDMSKWLQFVIDGGSVNGTRLISTESFQEWTKVHQAISKDAGYAFGWINMEMNGVRVLQHGGNIDGFSSLVGIAPDKRFGFVILTNANGSQFPGEMMQVILQEMFGGPPQPSGPAPAGAEKEAGKYTIEAANLVIEVRFEEGKLKLLVPGQPVYELISVGERRYRLGGAPAGFFAVFTDDSVLLEQPQGNYRLPKMKADGAPEAPDRKQSMSADEILSKAVEALGGESNWRRLSSRRMTVEIDFENQGVKGRGQILAKAPYYYAADTTLFALGKEIGKTFEYLNAWSGGQKTSFSPEEVYSGRRLEDMKLENGFYGLLDWRQGLKDHKVKGIEKVGPEEVWVVELTPQSGNPYRLYFSVKTFLPLKRAGVIASSTSSVRLPVTVLYEEYRAVDGVMLPFKLTTSTPTLGDVVTRVRDAVHNPPLNDSLFSPGK